MYEFLALALNTAPSATPSFLLHPRYPTPPATVQERLRHPGAPAACIQSLPEQPPHVLPCSSPETTQDASAHLALKGCLRGREKFIADTTAAMQRHHSAVGMSPVGLPPRDRRRVVMLPDAASLPPPTTLPASRGGAPWNAR